MFSAKHWKALPAVAALAVSAMALAGCGDGGSTQSGEASGSSDKPVLTVFAGQQTPIVANFNPYSPTVLTAALGGIYEPLFFYNKAEAEDPKPLLAESVDWSEDGLSLTIHLRKGVKWNDGQPLTADDVIYSFTNDGVQMDFVDDAIKVDDDTVKLMFNTPSYTNEYSLLGATYIVPKHVFGELDDLVTFDNAKDPVGTGPFIVESTTDAAYMMAKNPQYWDEGHPTLEKVQYLGIDGNSSAESLFKAQQLDYSTMFVPEPDSLTGLGFLGYTYVTSPNVIAILTCSNADLGCEGAQTDKAIRQAFDIAIDRDEINTKAYAGVAGDAAPTFVKPGRDDAWVAEGMPMANPDKADVEGAKKILEDAGYTAGSDGIYEKDGQRASFKMVSVEGWSDSNAAAELMVAQGKAAGIEVKAETVTLDQYTDMRQTGKYEMILSALVGTPISDPYTMYRNNFTTSFTQPVGTSLEPNQTNYARYSNPVVDEAVAEAATTNDAAKKKEAYAKIQKAIVEDVPYISMFHGGNQTFYNNVDFTGWPTEKDLYAFPAAWDGVSAAYVLSHVTYAK